MQTTDDNQSMYTLLMQLMFMSKHRMSKLAEGYDLSVMQSNALGMLDANEPKAMRMLSDYFMCDASTITGLVDRLEARGLITRTNHPTDRRIKLIGLTKRGAELKAKIQTEMAKLESERVNRILSPSEQANFRDYVQRLLDDQAAN